MRAGRGRIDGTEPDAPVSVYGRHKLGAERALKQASAEGVLRGVVLRLPTVFGQGPASVAPDRGVCATMIRRALAGEPLTMWHDGTVERDLLYVEDAARAFLAALDHADALAGRHWVVGTGVGTPLRALFTRIAELVAAATGAPPVPVASVPAPPEAAATDSVGYAIDSSAFRAATGWRPEVSLDDGLAATVRAMAGSALVRPA
ncbi:NAD-dependent epimerase/dehydratase family protein [Thermocatellispora tengchongensis]|uniref:NAD-dependent epimerase/dehydratase family protein n=1 Tax=Thermocatellispora tengchongensis TaxID=1073253 RepID=UPI003645B619